jgi:hypothetical protein
LTVDINDTRKCNIMNLGMVARYLNLEPAALLQYYDELLADEGFLEDVNHQMASVRTTWGFTKGIFSMGHVPSVDWFAFERVLIYVLIRHLRPQTVLETGVYYGGNSAFALLALQRNGTGRMVSIDYPDSEIRREGAAFARHSLVGDSELYDHELRPGFMVPLPLRNGWELVEGDSLKVIPSRTERFDFYIHDSDHSMTFLSHELAAAWERLTDDAAIVVDDVDWSNAFSAFCVQHRLFPLLMTDNGKDDLRVRSGLAMKSHPRNSDDLFT